MIVKAYKLKIHGLVQGVFFRKSTCEKARELLISGFVRNSEDGTVEVYAEGPDETLNAFMEWCHQGPTGAKVSRVDIHEEPLKKLQGFVITR